jgi:hypothetical protein
LLYQYHPSTVFLLFVSLIGMFWPHNGSAVNKNVWIETPVNTYDGVQTWVLCRGDTQDFTANTTLMPEGLPWAWSAGVTTVGSTTATPNTGRKTFTVAGTEYVTAAYGWEECLYAARVVVVGASFSALPPAVFQFMGRPTTTKAVSQSP